METKTLALPATTSRLIEYSLLATSFLIPFLISGPQLLTGTMVNALLYLFVLRSYSRTTLPLVILPSIGALLNGILFGKFTIFLLYFLPIIWIANYALVLSSHRLLKKTHSPLVAVGGSSLLKAAVLFSAAYLFVLLKIVPPLFLQLMGLFQLYTAVLGGASALAIHAIISNKKNHD